MSSKEYKKLQTRKLEILEHYKRKGVELAKATDVRVRDELEMHVFNLMTDALTVVAEELYLLMLTQYIEAGETISTERQVYLTDEAIKRMLIYNGSFRHVLRDQEYLEIKKKLGEAL